MVIIALFIFGLVLGSFVNALVWRVHERSRSKKKRANKRYSIWQGRSMCPSCGHELAAKDLVPVFSWVWLRGKCRYCHKPISAQYPFVELLTGGLFAVAYATWPYGFAPLGAAQFAFFAASIVLFVALAVYDVRWYLLPDVLVFTLIGLAAAQVATTAVVQQSLQAAWLPVAGAAVIFSIFWGLYQISGGKWIGGGDVKLAVALGLIAGSPLRAFLVIFFASLLGTLASLPLIARGKQGMTKHIPFGPYLLAACYIVVLFGERIVAWYTNVLV